MLSEKKTEKNKKKVEKIKKKYEKILRREDSSWGTMKFDWIFGSENLIVEKRIPVPPSIFGYFVFLIIGIIGVISAISIKRNYEQKL